MPFLGIGFHVIVALFFAVHVVRSNQNMYWLFILFVFPRWRVLFCSPVTTCSARDALSCCYHVVAPDNAAGCCRSPLQTHG